MLNDALQERADTRDWQAAGNVSPATVLDAYRNNTREGRIRALQVTFPVVEQLLGNAAFAAYAGDYVTRYPAVAADLDTFGDQFADFCVTVSRCRNCPTWPKWPHLSGVYRPPALRH
ncbi:DNA-binding domain-containing protein [Aliamphritea spongicola]|nr:DNA-binding domain-containing protein [Aliamphritea spongicola]